MSARKPPIGVAAAGVAMHLPSLQITQKAAESVGEFLAKTGG